MKYTCPKCNIKKDLINLYFVNSSILKIKGESKAGNDWCKICQKASRDENKIDITVRWNI